MITNLQQLILTKLMESSGQYLSEGDYDTMIKCLQRAVKRKSDTECLQKRETQYTICFINRTEADTTECHLSKDEYTSWLNVLPNSYIRPLEHTKTYQVKEIDRYLNSGVDRLTIVLDGELERGNNGIKEADLNERW